MTTQLLAAAQAVLFGTKEETTRVRSDWDRGWMAMACAQVDLDYAAGLLRQIFRRQNSNGALYWPTRQQAGYGAALPDPNVPNTKKLVELPEENLIFPPIYGFILEYIYKVAKEQKQARAILKEFYPKVMALHRFLYDTRDPLDEGLLVVQHPWEMGRFAMTDNAVAPLQDPFFNGLLTYSNECLIKIGSLLKADFLEAMDWHELTIYSMNEKLWDEDRGIYSGYDVQSDELIPYHDLYGFMPMLGEVPTQEQAEAMLLLLESEHFGGSQRDHFLCPTHSLLRQSSSQIDPLLNWMLYQGLERYDMYELADRVRQDTTAMMDQSGFKPNYSLHGSKAGNVKDNDLSDPIAAAVAIFLLS